MQNVSSEQELKQLLDDGKISEREYRELFQSMSEKETGTPLSNAAGGREFEGIIKRGKIAFYLVLGGFLVVVLGGLLAQILPPKNEESVMGICGLLFFIAELSGLVMGIMSWKNGFGKAATIVAALLLTVTIVNVIVWMFMSHEPVF